MTDPQLTEQVERFAAALAKLPTVTATTFRGGQATDALIDLYRPGAVIYEPGFTSTSADLSIATENFSGNLVLSISGTTGRNLSPYSAHPDEVEVVFDRGSRFYVLDLQQPDDDIWFACLADRQGVDPGDQLFDLRAEFRTARSRPPVSITSPGKFTGPIGLRTDGTPFREG